MSIVRAFENAFEKKEQRGWDHIYVFVDIHETVFKPTYDGDQKKFQYYRDAKTVLKILTRKKDVVLGLYTCSHSEQVGRFLDKFEEDGIHFELTNTNPMEKDTSYACFDTKPYFNVLLDDKAGFDAEVEWYRIKKYLQRTILVQMMQEAEEDGLYDMEGQDGGDRTMEGVDGGDGTMEGVDGEKKKI